MPYYRLKDLIKAIRACKTAADERAVIQKESAAIRTSFREDNNESRYANVAKLLYIHMLSYPAHFGQIECLKLVASSRFADKRLGYLGIMLLLDENQEVLTLVTNSLKNDMNHSNMYIVGLALCTLGNISSPEMARDLCAEVEKLLGSSNTYIRKKAALCAMRIVRKVPELQENFLSRAKGLLSDRNHGVLLAGVTLITELCSQNTEALQTFRKAVPLLVKHLKSLVSAGYAPEHDVTGITDPFLQVKILRLLRILGKGDVEASETMNDILAQVATSTESSKNVGNAILYETVLTIMEIQSESGLRVLAINILGKFLTNRDNNIRYVALTTLNKTVTIDMNAVQRHRNIILDCLRDGDISIRRRALELSFALINESNVRVLTRELLAFLEIADNEFKQGMTTKICIAAERFAPNKRWHIDTVLRVLKLAGNYVREEILSNFIRLIAQTTELNAYTVQKLYAALREDISQESLTLAGLWAIGEYGDILISGGSFEEEELVKEVTENEVAELIETILAGPYANQVIREYALTALMKLTARFADPNVIRRVRAIIEQYNASIEVEIQQRAVEYENLFQFDAIRPSVLDRMPIPEVKEETNRPTYDEDTTIKPRARTHDLLDLDSDEPILSTPGQPSIVDTGRKEIDLLADIFGETSINTSAPARTTTAATPIPNTKDDIMNLFNTVQPTVPTTSAPLNNLGLDSLGLGGLNTSGSGGQPFVPTQPFTTMQADILQATPVQQMLVPTDVNNMFPINQAVAQSGIYVAFDKDGFNMSLQPAKDTNNPNILNINVIFKNTGVGAVVENLLLKVAIPKTQKLQMEAPSSTTITPGGTATQLVRIANPQKTNIRLRLRLSYETATGVKVDEMMEFSDFPQELW